MVSLFWNVIQRSRCISTNRLYMQWERVCSRRCAHATPPTRNLYWQRRPSEVLEAQSIGGQQFLSFGCGNVISSCIDNRISWPRRSILVSIMSCGAFLARDVTLTVLDSRFMYNWTIWLKRQWISKSSLSPSFLQPPNISSFLIHSLTLFFPCSRHRPCPALSLSSHVSQSPR